MPTTKSALSSCSPSIMYFQDEKKLGRAQVTGQSKYGVLGQTIFFGLTKYLWRIGQHVLTNFRDKSPW